MSLFLITGHSPPSEPKFNGLWQDYLDDLDNCIARKKPDDILLIGMDCNSSIGVRGNTNTKVVGRHGKKTLNTPGVRLRSYLALLPR